MPAKLCDGSSTPELERTPLPRISWAFCDGRAAQLAGGSATDNPWDGVAANSPDKPLEEAWDRGFASSEKGCCIA